jgi:uncharacterized protein (DUF1697 family)
MGGVSRFPLIFIVSKVTSMSKYIALLRGINVGGQKIIKMEALRAMFEAAGCTDVQTYIQSGNVVFAHALGDASALRKHLETQLQAALGYAVPTLVRDAAQIDAVVADNPFPLDLPNFGKKVYVAFFEHAPSQAAIASLLPYVTETERFVMRGSEAYIYYDEGLGKSKFSNAIIERKLGMATMRNWNTVTTLLEMAR